MRSALLALGLGLCVASLAANAQDTMRIAIYGDSTALGEGADVRWYQRLDDLLGVTTEIHQAGVGRSNMSRISAAIVKDEDHRDWTTIVYDRRNAGESVDQWLSDLAAGLGHLTSDRFLILPQVPVSGGREDQKTLSVMLAINEELRARYPNNTLDAELEAELLLQLSDDETRADHIHRNDRGQEIEARLVGEWLAGKGWGG